MRPSRRAGRLARQAAVLLTVLACVLPACRKPARKAPTRAPAASRPARAAPTTRPVRPGPQQDSAGARFDPDAKFVHVFVALCDNKNQGIVKVPAALGNGQDPDGNLYWGAMYGLRTFFRKSTDWRELKAPTAPASKAVLDRVVFESADALDGPTYVIADAYDGARMTEALTDFFHSAAGRRTGTVEVTAGGVRLQLPAAGRADLVCFVGHNGLMDTPLADYPAYGGKINPPEAVVLACKSHAYFAGPLRKAKCSPLVTTTGLMAPEAYSLDAILRAWAAGKDADACRRAAALAYGEYQKDCSLPAAMRLFLAGR